MKLQYDFNCPNCSSKGTIELKIGAENLTPVLKRRKKEEPPTPFFTETVAHIDEAWRARKKAKFHWESRFFRDLRGLIRNYTAFGVMALYDQFMNSNDDWVRTTGHSFPAFISSIPRLVDDPGWKQLKSWYEDKLAPIAPEIATALRNTGIGEKVVP